MPQTVPNKPTNGAVDPTEASTAKPDCKCAVASSMARCKQRVTQSLTSSCCAKAGRAALFCTWSSASRACWASWRKGLSAPSPKACSPAATLSQCQKASTNWAWRWCRHKWLALRKITTQEDMDMASSNKATKRVTMSPWVHRLTKPNSLFMRHSFPNLNSIGT